MHVVAVVGPTASGKTAFAVELAEALGTEIVSADSMQFYRGMAIGTGQPSAEELERVRHHFVACLDPDESITAGQYQLQAREVVANINAQGKPAVVVGGSGLYVRALIDGLFDGPGKDPDLRARLSEQAAEEGVPTLYSWLRKVDPAYANVVNANDLRRIIRGLEVHTLTGQPLSLLHETSKVESEALDAVQLALNWPREELYARINARVDAMMADGLLDEVRALQEAGYEDDIFRLKSLGYQEMVHHLRGECTLEDAVERMKMFTRRYAKRQLSWFHGDTRVKWFSLSADESPVFQVKHALRWLEVPELA